MGDDNRIWIIGLIFGLVIGVGVTVVVYETEEDASKVEDIRQDMKRDIESIKRELSKLNDKAEG